MSVRPPWAVDGVQAAGADIRLAQGALLAPAGLLRAREGSLGVPVVVAAQATPNRTVSVPAFAVVVDNDGFGSGPVVVINDAPVTVPVAAFDTTIRKDIIVVGWVGEEQAVANRKADVYIIKGVGSSGGVPVAPPVPANAVLLATISVPTSTATVITNANITNSLLQTTAAGGITPSRNATDVSGAYVGQYRDRGDIGGLERWNGSAWKYASLGIFGPAPLPLFGNWTGTNSSNLAPAEYMRDNSNRCHLSGVAVNVAGFTANGADVIGRLPDGMWPQYNYQFVGALYLAAGGTPNRAAYFQFQVNQDGNVYVVHASTGLPASAGEGAQNVVPAGCAFHLSGASFPLPT